MRGLWKEVPQAGEQEPAVESSLGHSTVELVLPCLPQSRSGAPVQRQLGTAVLEERAPVSQRLSLPAWDTCQAEQALLLAEASCDTRKG